MSTQHHVCAPASWTADVDVASALCATSACTLVMSLSPSACFAYSLFGNRRGQRLLRRHTITRTTPQLHTSHGD